MPTNEAPPTRSPRRQRNHEMMVRTILETARAIMREDGVAALSMQELARRLDMRAPSLYHYFAGKMAIYDALFRLGFTRYADQLRANTDGVLTWQEEVRLVFETYMAFAVDEPDLFQLCFERPVPGFVPSAESMQMSLDLLNQGYERAAQWTALAASGLEPKQLMDLLIAIMHGLTALHLANEPHLPPGEGRFGSLIPVALAVLDRAWSRP